MRHHNPTSASCVSFSRNTKATEPYNHEYIDSYNKSKFATANPKKAYIKALQYIADHVNCRRVDININVFGWKKHVKTYGIKRTSECSRGQHSNMYSQLIYLDLIDYDKDYRYHITDKGLEILKTAYLNEMEKTVKNT